MKKEAKKKALEMLKDYMSKMAGKSLMDGLSVKVSSDSPEGLEEGLKKAQEIVKEGEIMEDEEYPIMEENCPREELLKKLFEEKYKK
jgi:hypothetical protein